MKVAVEDSDLAKLLDLASTVLESDDAETYCRGIRTTTDGMAAIVARCDKARAEAKATPEKN